MIFMISIMVLFAGNAIAGGGNGGGNYGGNGEVGLDISGGSLVGIQGYTGSTGTLSSSSSCFNKSVSLDKTNYIGANVMSSANGMTCLKTSGHPSGGVNGFGNFKSGVEGSMMGVDFYTNSRVNISGYSN